MLELNYIEKVKLSNINFKEDCKLDMEMLQDNLRYENFTLYDLIRLELLVRGLLPRKLTSIKHSDKIDLSARFNKIEKESESKKEATNYFIVKYFDRPINFFLKEAGLETSSNRFIDLYTLDEVEGLMNNVLNTESLKKVISYKLQERR